MLLISETVELCALTRIIMITDILFPCSNSTQTSSAVNLISGEFYFMQAVMKAGSNSYDHLGVGVRQPSGRKYQPVLNPDLYYEIPGVSVESG